MASSLPSLLFTPPSAARSLLLFRTPPSCLFSSYASTSVSLHHHPDFLASQLLPLAASLAPGYRHQTKTFPKGMLRQPKITSCLSGIEIGRELSGRVLLGLFKKVPKTSKSFRLMYPAHSMAQKKVLFSFAADKLLSSNDNEKQQAIILPQFMLWAAVAGFPIFANIRETAYASSNGGPNVVYNEISAVLEFGVQLLYLGALLALLGIGSFLVVRQILIRRELETAAKDLQDRVRAGEATSVEYFELGAVMLRKKFFSLATKYLELSIEKWDGDGQDLAKVYNALGFSYLSDGKVDKAIIQYEKAVKLQPGYVVAWNNLGDAYEKKKDLPSALKAYEQALLFDPNNRVARTCQDSLKGRVDRLKGVPMKYD